jgi:hypothetical protein
MFIKLDVRDSKDSLCVKLIYGLLSHLMEELELFFDISLEHAFHLASKIEAKFPKTNPISQKKVVSCSKSLATCTISIVVDRN